MKIDTFETVTTNENLINWKLWFNGMKKFSSIKVNPPQQPKESEEENPPDLGIHIEDTVDTAELFGDR